MHLYPDNPSIPGPVDGLFSCDISGRQTDNLDRRENQDWKEGKDLGPTWQMEEDLIHAIRRVADEQIERS